MLALTDVPRAAAFRGAALGHVPACPVTARCGRRTTGRCRCPPRERPGRGSPRHQRPPGAGSTPGVHLDPYVDDAAEQAAEVERLVALGAGRVGRRPARARHSGSGPACGGSTKKLS